MDRKRAHLWISGRVQGVTFRASTRDEAGRLELSGWVKNLQDGRVEAVVEGKAEAVDELVDWCHEGPSLARVENVETEESAFTGEFDGFEVRH